MLIKLFSFFLFGRRKFYQRSGRTLVVRSRLEMFSSFGDALMVLPQTVEPTLTQNENFWKSSCRLPVSSIIFCDYDTLSRYKNGREDKLGVRQEISKSRDGQRLWCDALEFDAKPQLHTQLQTKFQLFGNQFGKGKVEHFWYRWKAFSSHNPSKSLSNSFSKKAKPQQLAANRRTRPNHLTVPAASTQSYSFPGPK